MKRWTEKEDRFLVAFFDAIGDYIGPHDLGRSKAATRARAKKLKNTGAWEAYKTADHHRCRAMVLAGHWHADALDEYPLQSTADLRSVS